uniref:alanine--tRNA ligase n=1 Tax=Caenorhabditis japonica TaxID=281687 RepID=A0A8R1IEW9_CAEJA
NDVFTVESAKKIAGGSMTILFGKATQPIQRGGKVVQRLDEKRRKGLMRAHSATHLLNWALQKSRLGTAQKGSSVDCDRLRFDYSTRVEHLEKEQRLEKLKTCEELMKEFIGKGGETRVQETTMEEAKKIENLQSDVKEDRIGGACVRIVALGTKEDVPVECCSGTHVLNVNTIGDVVIISDKSIGTKTRRIIALTGNEAKECRQYVENVEKELKEGNDKSAIGKVGN